MADYRRSPSSGVDMDTQNIEQGPDWFQIAQAATRVANQLANENLQHRIELERRGMVENNELHQIAALEARLANQRETIQNLMCEREKLHAQMSVIQDDVLGHEDMAEGVLSSDAIQFIIDFDPDKEIADCGCDDTDTG